MTITSTALELDYAATEKEILRFIRKVVKDAGAKGVIVGLSGGIDSSVVCALCVRALGKERVVGVLMPASHTPVQDNRDARDLAKSLGIKTYKVDIDEMSSTLRSAVPLKQVDRVTLGNSKARIRMVILYYFANALGLMVTGTGDRSEDMVGFYTKFGDGGVDFLPIAHLYKTQVRALGAHLGLPSRVVTKPASPQLWPGHKATDEIPLDYDKMDLVLQRLFDAKVSPERAAKETGVALEVVETVLRKHRSSEHKRVYPPMVRPW